MSRFSVPLMLALAFVAAPASAKSVLFNGSFEDGVPGNVGGMYFGSTYANMPVSGSSWDIWRSLSGWTTVSGTGVEVQTKRTLGLTPHSGNYYIELDSAGNSAIRQMVDLTRGRYKFSFAYSPRSTNPGTNNIHFALTDLVSGTAHGPNPGQGTRTGQWTLFSYDLKVENAGSYALTLGGSGRSDGVGGLIDSVALTPVPVPAAGAVLLAGLGALAAVRRRRKA